MDQRALKFIMKRRTELNLVSGEISHGTECKLVTALSLWPPIFKWQMGEDLGSNPGPLLKELLCYEAFTVIRSFSLHGNLEIWHNFKIISNPLFTRICFPKLLFFSNFLPKVVLLSLFPLVFFFKFFFSIFLQTFSFQNPINNNFRVCDVGFLCVLVYFLWTERCYIKFLGMTLANYCF